MKKIARIAAAAAICIFNTMEAKDAMETLTPKEKSIALSAAYAARGDQNGLKASLADGLDSGVTVNEYKEVLVQVYAYCGFPRSLNALGTFMELLKERGGKDAQGKLPGPLPEGKSLDFGTDNQTKLTGREVKGPLFEFAPAIDEFLKAHLFGDIFARDNLDWRTREVATIAMLAAMDGVESQLKSHIAIGKHNGLSDAQVGEILALVRNGPLGMENTSPFPLGGENAAYSKYFTGKSYLARLTKDGKLGVPVANVTFAPRLPQQLAQPHGRPDSHSCRRSGVLPGEGQTRPNAQTRRCRGNRPQCGTLAWRRARQLVLAPRHRVQPRD